MKSPNKIRERDMDDDFLLSLRSGMDSVEVSRLLTEYLRRDEVISAGQLPINDIRTLLGLDKEDLDTLMHTFVSVILKLIGTEQSKGFKVSIQKNDSTYVIKVIDDDGKEHDVIVYNDSAWNINGVLGVLVDNNGTPTSVLVDDENGVQHEILVNPSDSDSYANENVIRMISDLQTQVTNLQSKVNQLESSGSSGGGSSSGGDSALYENIINEVNLKNEELINRINDYELIIRELQRRLSVLESVRDEGDTITETRLSQDIIDKLNKVEEIQSTVDTLDDKYLQVGRMSEGQVIHCVYGNSVVGGRDLVIYATICVDDDEVAQAESEKRELIINVSSGMKYEYDSENDEYDELPFLGDHKNDNVFICNIDTENIQFVVLDDKFIEFAGGGMTGGSGAGVTVTMKSFEIPLNQSVEVERLNNLRKVPPTILIKDKLADSRTYGQYINSEGFVTVSNTTSSFTIYNDSPYILEVVAIMMNSAPGTADSTDDTNTDNTSGGDGE